MRHAKFALTFMMLLMAFAISAQDATQQQNSIEQNQVADLKRQLPAEQISLLSAQDAEILTLQLENMTSYAKGTAILVPDAGEHVASPKHIDNLRQQLTDYGWHTIALMPPALPVELTDDSMSDYQQRLLLRLQAGLQQASNNPGATIIIAQGSSAALINKLFASAQLTEPSAFIMLGAYLPSIELNAQIAKALASHQVPTLDISQTADNHLVTAKLRQRQKLVNKYLKAVYRQRIIPGSGYNAETQQWVFNEIYGWLTSVGL